MDKIKQKTDKVIKNCKAHGLSCVEVFCYDSTKCYVENSDKKDDGQERPMKPPFEINTFDKVLLDAPCSGLGQRPQLVNKITPKMLESYKFVQRKLFNAVSI